MAKKTGEFSRLRLTKDLIGWGWPLERLDEIEYPPDKNDPSLPGMSYFDLKKLWTEWKRGERRLDTAKALGATEEQAPEVVHWAGKSLDTVRKACLRTGLSPGVRHELFLTAQAALQGLLANPAFESEDPTITARKAVTYATALQVEIERELLHRREASKDSSKGDS